MAKPPAAIRAALIFWIVLGGAGVAYARLKEIPTWAALPMIAAFLAAYPFYLVPAFPALRNWVGGRRLPGYLLASAVLPYGLACLGAIRFEWLGIALLVALALALAFWFRVLPKSPWTDLLFLALIPAVLLGGYLTRIYLPALPKLKDAVFLGHITLIQLAVTVLLFERGVPPAGYGFLPSRREWRIGLVHFAYFAPLGVALAWAMRLAHFTRPAPLWLIAGSFIGFLWTVALSEEFFIWGVLQPWIAGRTGSRQAALIGAALIFGAIHLGFRGFPNWRWAILAATLGWFCGRARNLAGSIRAAMVTHALVFACWRAFFSA